MGGIDQSHKAIIVHFLQGIIKVIPIAKAASDKDILFKESFDVRIQKLNIIALSVLHDKPLCLASFGKMCIAEGISRPTR